VDTKKICPEGWHIPTDAEWHSLVLFLDPNAALSDRDRESMLAGNKMKETGTVHWLSPNNGVTNETGFSALPGGYRYGIVSGLTWFHGQLIDGALLIGTFDGISEGGTWWSSTDGTNSDVWPRQLSYGDGGVYYNYNDKQMGYSVRCLKDN
jgi:uncharacterized protein (TIGR02145 family)